MVLPSATLDSMPRCSITQIPKPTDLTNVDKHISAKIRIQTKLYRHHKQTNKQRITINKDKANY